MTYKTIARFLLISTLLFSSIFIQAQNSFRYQAVARDSAGATIANQLIGIQISIIQVDEILPAIYEEMHQVTSNDYGVINLSVGEGIPLLGDFGKIDWGLTSFVKVEIDVTGGANYDLVSMSQILSVPRALYAERAGSIEGSRFGLNVLEFGAVRDGTSDDTDAFEMALDSAKIVGAKVFVPNGIYKITRTLNIGEGVSLIGEGPGSDPLQTPFNGSLIWFEGDGFAMNIQGHNVRIKDLVIRDKSSQGALGGILLEADGRLVESVHLSDILISNFLKGTALKLSARNLGGIAYASFDKIRIRHGKIGIHLTQTEDSFVNSNNWNSCQISGGGFDKGLVIDGGNNNTFNDVVIEPPMTNFGHVIINKGKIFGAQIRIEGINQPADIPLIKFSKNTRNSTLTGVYAGGLTIDEGNNFINMKSGKAIHYQNSNFNKFKNATFFSPDNIQINDWEIKGNGVSINVLPPELSEFHNVLEVTIPAGVLAEIEPHVLARPAIKNLPLYEQVNFGFHIKSDHPNVAYTATNAPLGWTNSTPHSGSGNWEFVGMNAAVNQTTPARFVAQINNNTGSEITIYISTPTLSFGNQLPTLEEPPLMSSGGRLTGMLTHSMASVETPSNGFLRVPLTANYFEITNIQNIYRVNHLTADRAPKGSVITLLFNHAGIGVTNSGYLNLKDGFTSVTNGSLTLISNGNGTWREVSRNN